MNDDIDGAKVTTLSEQTFHASCCGGGQLGDMLSGARGLRNTFWPLKQFLTRAKEREATYQRACTGVIAHSYGRKSLLVALRCFMRMQARSIMSFTVSATTRVSWYRPQTHLCTVTDNAKSCQLSVSCRLCPAHIGGQDMGSDRSPTRDEVTY
jgi:hypothetical protein